MTMRALRVRKKKRKNKNKPSKTRFEAYTAEEWDEFYKTSPPRLLWKEDCEYGVIVQTDEGLKPYPVHVQVELLKSYWAGAISCEVNFQMTSGRHEGHDHTYTIYWLGGLEGIQFSPKNSAKTRQVVVTVRKQEARHWRQGWESSAGASESWQWD